MKLKKKDLKKYKLNFQPKLTYQTCNLGHEIGITQ
jgi:hypothetical protein